MKRRFGAIRAIMRKEFHQIVRDPRTVAVLFVIPTALLLLVGYAINFDVKNIKVAVFDHERSVRSRQFVEGIVHSEYFSLVQLLRDDIDVRPALDRGDVSAVIIIPSGFSDHLMRGEAAPVQVLIDGSNSTTATTVVGYVNAALQAFDIQVRLEALERIGREAIMPLDLRARVWYNPELKSVRYLVPGLIAYVLMITSVVATAMSIVREKERGTMEQILVSPVSPLELIIGKILPYLMIAIIATGMLLLTAWGVFGVGVRGNLLLLFASLVLFLLCALGVGLFISTLAATQQIAFQLSVLASALPAMLLSGFIFPIRSMPIVVQYVTYITPTRYYVATIRAIMLKGVGLRAFAMEWLAMGIFATVILTISALRLRLRKEGG
jgi:ABC-2 type transport system permease protein